ncbi:TPA: integrase [Salmonella enterica]|nr:integrase [Salmonella enterica]
MAGKRKNPAHAIYPPRVYRGKSKFEYHPASGGAISLCPLDSPVSMVWAEYEKAKTKKDQERVVTISTLVDEFFSSTDFCNLAQDTRKDYTKYANKLMPVFGKMSPDNLKPQHVRQYMDKRGVASQVQANREKAFLSRLYSWAYERGKVSGNPCKGVRQFKEVPRDRYISHEEYDALYSVSPPVIQVAMELAYLCLARQKDVLTLKKSELFSPGIYIDQNKTGVKQIKAWSDRLRSVIDLAKTLPLKDGMSSIYVLHKSDGQKYTRDGFNSRWESARQIAREKFPHLRFDFTFHDLKAKGVSDLDGTLQEKQQISGHKTITQTARYDRKVKVVPVVGGQKKA